MSHLHEYLLPRDYLEGWKPNSMYSKWTESPFARIICVKFKLPVVSLCFVDGLGAGCTYCIIIGELDLGGNKLF